MNKKDLVCSHVCTMQLKNILTQTTHLSKKNEEESRKRLHCSSFN